jgi:hypothetical protein
MATACKCVKTSPQTSVTKEVAVASQQCTVFHQGPFDQKKKNMTVIPHPPYLRDLAPYNFPVSPVEDKTERP